ncbi:GNAT family N-acetyltransferase [Glycomyces luteolus]|uniref:GNAT family N-acetyltransferase n=1 Tax=Glycomyces luteolus TaxID=2670330 RepID=A0A9X3P6A7_9ACTN|nr:GNAT family N-acetyltransferase [Glycomyces luteolus]MDA1358884.1 GNAT family N-acetyltransferase [Glycomyces luteolus]
MDTGEDGTAADDKVEIRIARADEFTAVAGLRWQWEVEVGETPTMPRETFEKGFAEWARRHIDSHRCIVVSRNGTVVGMAWLAVIERVPTPDSMARATGDLQSVYLVPEARNGGLGSRLIAASLDEARTLGLPNVTVQSTTRAVPVYSRNGFAASPKVLQADL